MSAPSPLTGRGRGVAKPRWYRWKPIRRPGAETPEEEAAWPEHTWSLPFARRAIPPGEPDPARARWVRLVLDDPAAARRERLEARLAYWRARLQALLERERAAREEWLEAAADPATPAAVNWDLQAAHGAAWADVQATRARLAEIERELEQ